LRVCMITAAPPRGLEFKAVWIDSESNYDVAPCKRSDRGRFSFGNYIFRDVVNSIHQPDGIELLYGFRNAWVLQTSPFAAMRRNEYFAARLLFLFRPKVEHIEIDRSAAKSVNEISGERSPTKFLG